MAPKTAPPRLDRARTGTVDLTFAHADEMEHVNDPIWRDVSCLTAIGRSIFCACDETSSVERLTFDGVGDGSGRADRHRHFPLGAAFELPEGPAGEMDIEGMAIDDGWLWVCGSHALKRDKPDEDGLAAMAGLDWDANRGFLGRLPLLEREPGIYEPVAEIDRLDGESARRAAMLPMTDGPDTLLRSMLADDPLIGPFIDLPCKENGFDIEGLAVRGETVLLGLRGPVVGGYALIVRLEMKMSKNGDLKPRKLDSGGRYAVQAVDLAGQGIRDMAWDGDRLLLLTGATTDLEALQSVVAIDDYDPARPLYRGGLVKRVLDLPIVRGADHAEGLALIETDNGRRLLATYDSPHDSRIDPKAQRLRADVFTLE